MKLFTYSFLLLALAISIFFPAKAILAAPVDVLVWDLYFDFSDSRWPKENNQGRLGDVFSFSSSVPKDHKRGPHGIQVSYVLLKDRPEITAHLAYNPGIPWQDPEICSLTEDGELNGELRKFGYPLIPLCHAEAEAGIQRLEKFIRDRKIKVVNLSNGVYFDHYNHKNPYLLSARYPLVNIDFIFRHLYRNFLEIGKIVAPLFARNPEVLFVLAAGNNGDEVDRQLYLKGFDFESGMHPVPTMFASLTSKFDNVISVASSYDGKDLAGGSNYGKENVYVAKKIGAFQVPDENGNWMAFGGTSAAAAETSRMAATAISNLGHSISPQMIKLAMGKSVLKEPKLSEKVTTGGLINESAFVIELKKMLGELATTKIPPSAIKLPVIEKSAKISQFHLPADINPKSYGCHSLAIDKNDIVWMTMPWAGMFVSFDPAKNLFTRYPLPTPDSRPDGISIDHEGNIWAGVHPKGGLVMLNPATEEIREFQHPRDITLNITTVNAQGKIWATGHQGKILTEFDPKTGTFSDIKVKADWPLDIRADEDGSIWATGLKGYNVPWGPGAFIHLAPGATEPTYIPLPEAEDRLQVLWVSPFKNKVVGTMMRDGLMILDRASNLMVQYKRDDGQQLYQIARRLNDQHVAILNHADKVKSLDILNVNKPDAIFSYRVPNQIGEPREGLAFDSKGNAWFCQNFTDILGKIELSEQKQ